MKIETGRWSAIDPIAVADCSKRHIQSVLEGMQAEIKRLNGLINTPHTDSWLDAVRLEAAHQIERWGVDHDPGKEHTDWFWFVGYLSGKCLAAAIYGNEEKAKHHTISTGAALLNWHRAISGESNAMQPGHAPSAVLAGDQK